MKNFETQIANTIGGHKTLVEKYMTEKYYASFANGFAKMAAQWSGDENIFKCKWVGVDCGKGFYLYPEIETETIRAKTCFDFIQVTPETFGLALSVFCVNHFAWHLSEAAQKDWESIEKFNDQFYFVRDLGYDEKLNNVTPVDVMKILD